MRGSVASRCRVLLPWATAIALVLVAVAICVDVLRQGLHPLGELDLPVLVLFVIVVVGVPAAALVLAYRAHVREERQRSEVVSLLAIMRDVHAAAVTDAAAAVLLEHARSLVAAAGSAAL